MSSIDIAIQTGLQDAIELYHKKQLGKAIVLLNELVEEYPMSIKPWGYLGFLHRQAKQPLAAERCFRKAVALSPKSEHASLGLFYTLWELKRMHDALREMGRFLTIGRANGYLSLFLGPARNRQPVRTSGAMGRQGKVSRARRA
jgi:predicted Zn-dependent protease